MPPLKRSKLRALLAKTDRAHGNAAKGKAWERVVTYLFSSIPGLSVSATNPVHVLDQYEIDVAMWNDQVPTGLKSLPDVIFIEAKNWHDAVTSKEIRSFDSKLAQQGLSLGVLIAANGVTGDPIDRTAGYGVIGSALTQARRIIVLTREEISAVKTSRQLVQLIKKKICDLVVRGSL